jgi:tape measure domain-containing protein
MAEFIEFLSPSALKELQIANAELVKMISNVDTVGTKMKSISTPSGSDSALKSLTAQYEAQSKAIQDLQKQISELVKLKSNNNQKTQEEITNTRILASNANRQVLATSQLAGAYRNLSANVAIASEKVQNIIARGRTAEQTQKQYNRELRQAQQEFQKLQTRVLAADNAVGKWNRTNERSIGLGRDLLSAFGVVGGVTAFALITKDIFQQTKEIQSLNNALLLVTGTQDNFYKQQVFLNDISERYGVELNSLTKQFTQFYVSAKDKLAGDEIQKIFESITKAGASMGLSVESQQRAFLALNQMMSKGTIQAEELRGQLGEALPGAFGIMAEAVGVTEKELAKMMKSGQLIASEVLPKFAEQLEKTYGIMNVNRIETLTSSQNRLTNAWRNFIAELDKGDNAIGNFFKKAIDLATDFIELISPDKNALTIQLENQARGEKQILNELNSIKKEAIQTDNELIKTAQLKRKYAYEQTNALGWEISMLQDYGKEQSKIIAQVKKDNPYFFGNTKEYKEAKNNLEETNIKIRELAKSLGFYEGIVKGTLSFQRQMNDENKKETQSIKETEAEREKRIKKLREEYLERTKIQNFEKPKTQQGLLSKLKEQKKAFEDLQQQTSNTNKEFQDFQTIIEGVQQSIDLIEDPSKVITTTGVDEFMNRYSNSVQTSLEESKGFWEQYGQEVTDLSQELINTLAEISNQRFETQLANLEKERDIAILFAGESASAREEIERQYEERRAQIQKRQAEAQKKLAIFNIITDTAQAVIATLAQTPPPAGIPLAVLVGAIGAAQLALVASQPPPQFAKGTDNAPEGWAITQEKGREIITDKSGKVKSLGNDKGAQYTYLNKGDKVFTNADTEAMMFNSNLNNMLLGNGIVMPKVEVSLDAEKITNEIKSLANTIANKEGLTIVRDERGERKYLRKQAETKELLNNVLTYKGIDV